MKNQRKLTPEKAARLARLYLASALHLDEGSHFGTLGAGSELELRFRSIRPANMGRCQKVSPPIVSKA